MSYPRLTATETIFPPLPPPPGSYAPGPVGHQVFIDITKSTKNPGLASGFYDLLSVGPSGDN